MRYFNRHWEEKMKIKESTGMGEGKSFRLSMIILGPFLFLFPGQMRYIEVPDSPLKTYDFCHTKIIYKKYIEYSRLKNKNDT